jgi:hypothetical protein
MMRNINLIIVTALMAISSTAGFAGQSHSEHRGNGGKNNNTGASACREARVGKIKPAALSEVAPGSEFSFMVFEANNPKQIDVTVKNIHVPITIDDKGEMAIVHGKLPEEIKATAARITVKVKGKTSKCNSEDGWLLKVKE